MPYALLLISLALLACVALNKNARKSLGDRTGESRTSHGFLDRV